MTDGRTDGMLMMLEARQPKWPRRFRAVVGGCMAVLAFGIVGALAAGDLYGGWLPLLVLASLFVGAEHRDRLFVDETGLSGSIAVATAAAMYFGADGRAGGAFLVCAVGGLYVPHLRHREWSKIAINAACFGLSGVASAVFVALVVDLGADALVLAMAAIPTSIVYWIVNSALLSIATTSLRGGSLIRSTITLIKSDTVMLVFAVCGALCGLVMTEIGPWVGIAALAASLVALDVFVLSVPGGPAALRSSWRMVLTRLCAGGVAGLLAAGVADAVVAPALGAATGLLAGLGVGLCVVCLVAAGRLLTAGAVLDARLMVGFAVAELPLLLIAACSGVVGAEVGAAAGLVTASALVALGSAVAVWRRTGRPSTRVDDDLLLAAVTEAILDGMPESLPQR